MNERIDEQMAEANSLIDYIEHRTPINIAELEHRFIERMERSGYSIVLTKLLASPAFALYVSGIELQTALSEVANNARWPDE